MNFDDMISVILISFGFSRIFITIGEDAFISLFIIIVGVILGIPNKSRTKQSKSTRRKD